MMIKLFETPVRFSDSSELALTKSPIRTNVPTDDYVAISRTLEINTIPLKLAELEKVLARTTLGIYDYQAVVRYLDEQVEHLNNALTHSPHLVHWYWMPVKPYGYLSECCQDIHVINQIYSKPIPPQVCDTIYAIFQQAPYAQFYVSDIRSFPDPFLGVSVSRSDTMHVIERWDEPTFREKRPWR